MRMPHGIIRAASPGEAVLLSGIIRESFSDVARRFNLTPQNCPSHPSNCTVDWIEKDFRRGVVYFVAEHQGVVKGCVALEKAGDDLVYLERLAVLPAYRRNGWGSALVDYIIVQAEKVGARRISIGIIAEQSELGRWYRKLGFVAQEKKEFPQLPFVVVFMSYAVADG